MRSITLSLLVGIAVCACGPSRVDVSPVPGESVAYLQRFRIDKRTSGGEELPDITIEQRVTVTCENASEESARVRISYGDASVWIDGRDGDPAFVATDAGAIQRLYERGDIQLEQVYAALWAAMAHVELDATVDRDGVVHGVVGLDEVKRRRDGDVATDLGGSMLESLISDPALLSFATNADGESRISFRLEYWKASFHVAAVVEERDGGTYALSCESDSGDQLDGPFVALSLTISGAGSRAPGTGMPDERTLHLIVSAGVPIDANGTVREDAAQITYSLARTDG